MFCKFFEQNDVVLLKVEKTSHDVFSNRMTSKFKAKSFV